jgi:hypothetical protein
MFGFVILWQAPLVHSFCTYHNLYHIPSSVFCDANNEQSLVDRMFDIPNESKSKNRCAMTYYLQAFETPNESKSKNRCAMTYYLQAFETPVLDVTQLSLSTFFLK